MNVRHAILALAAGCGCAGDAAGQRRPLDVTLEVLDDVSAIDAVVMPLEAVGIEDGDRGPAAVAEPEGTAGPGDAAQGDGVETPEAAAEAEGTGNREGEARTDERAGADHRDPAADAE